MHRRQTRMYLGQQRAVEDRVAAKRAADPGYLLSEEERELLAEVDVFLGRTTTGALNVQRALDAAVQSVPTEVLRAELHHELLQAAHSWSDEEWAAVLRVYEARQKARVA